MSKAEDKSVEEFEKTKQIKYRELEAVINFLRDKVGLKSNKAIMMQRSSIEYIRGVNFHVAVLAHSDYIMKMIPTFVKEKQITKLNTIEDSIRLGQFMMLCQNMIQVRADHRIVGEDKKKLPKYVIPDKATNPMQDKGMYMILENEADQQRSQTMWLVIIVVVILALMCFRLWPMWLKKGIWYCSFYLLVFLAVTAVLRLILWVLLYHFGFEFWLFPNYFIDSNDPRDSFWPLYSFETRGDFGDVRSIIFRLASGALIVYMGWQFCQDEKNMADLSELAENGLDDFFNYGQDFMIGNALGDGGASNKNKTEETTEKSFQEKYREQLKKDIDGDNFMPDDDEEDNTTQEGEDDNPEEESNKKNEPSASDLLDNLPSDDEDEAVGAQE